MRVRVLRSGSGHRRPGRRRHPASVGRRRRWPRSRRDNGARPPGVAPSIRTATTSSPRPIPTLPSLNRPGAVRPSAVPRCGRKSESTRPTAPGPQTRRTAIAPRPSAVSTRKFVAIGPFDSSPHPTRSGPIRDSQPSGASRIMNGPGRRNIEPSRRGGTGPMSSGGRQVTSRRFWRLVLAVAAVGSILPVGMPRQGRRCGGSQAAQCPAHHDRRPGLRRSRIPRQSPDQDAEPRSVRPGERAAQDLLRLAGLLADAGQPHDRPVQLPHRRRRHLSRALHDAPRRGRRSPRCSPRPVIGPASSASGTWATTPRCGRSIRGSRGRWCSRAAASASRPTRRAAAAISTRSCSTTAGNGRFRAIAATSSPTAAIDFIVRAPDDRPFFAYLPFNCPHEPLQAPEAELAAYQGDEPRCSDVPPASRTRVPAGLVDPGRGHRPGLCDGHQYRHQRRASPRRPSTSQGPGREHDRRLPDRQRPGQGPLQRRPAGTARGPSTRAASACRAMSAGRANFPPGGVVDRIAAHIDLVPDACWTPAGWPRRRASSSTARA